jgi:small subunit ribosomal protein S17
MSSTILNKVKKAKPIKCIVVSAKTDKTRVAKVDRLVKEGRVGKYLRRQTKIMFHDEANKSQLGDTVLINPCRPKSASKRFELVEVLSTHSE